MTDSRGCEHEGTEVETASNRLNGVADPEGATPYLRLAIETNISRRQMINGFAVSESSQAIGRSLLLSINETLMSTGMVRTGPRTEDGGFDG